VRTTRVHLTNVALIFHHVLRDYADRCSEFSSFNVAIAQPTRVTISGLQGTYIGTGHSGASTDIGLTDLKGSKATELFSAQFDPLATVLTLSMATTLQVVPAKLYVMSFVVRVSMSTQDAPEVFIGTIGDVFDNTEGEFLWAAQWNQSTSGINIFL
jgi:hypothetical protein